MPSQKHFFATGKDLSEAIARSEASVAVRYVNGMLSDTPTLQEWPSLAAWPGLGVCQNESPHSCGFFLVLPAHIKIRVRTIEMLAGGRRYKPHVSDNPDAFVFEPGGEFIGAKNDVKLVVGKIATTAVCSAEAEIMFKQFSSAFLRGFKRSVGAFCGPGALGLIAAGNETSW
jgi:hypothetical protein